MRLIVLLHVRVRQLQLPSHLVPHHLLLQNLVADLRLEILEVDTLLLRRLRQIVHRRQLVVLANLIQTPYHIRVRVQTQFLCLRKQKLFVDHVTQHVPLRQRQIPRAHMVLLRVARQLMLRPLHIAATDDLIVYPRDHILHHLAMRRNRRRQRRQIQLRCRRIQPARVPRSLHDLRPCARRPHARHARQRHRRRQRQPPPAPAPHPRSKQRFVRANQRQAVSHSQTGWARTTRPRRVGLARQPPCHRSHHSTRNLRISGCRPVRNKWATREGVLPDTHTLLWWPVLDCRTT